VDFRLSLDFFDSGLYTCTAVARLTLALAKLSCFLLRTPLAASSGGSGPQNFLVSTNVTPIALRVQRSFQAVPVHLRSIP